MFYSIRSTFWSQLVGDANHALTIYTRIKPTQFHTISDSQQYVSSSRRRTRGGDSCNPSAMVPISVYQITLPRCFFCRNPKRQRPKKGRNDNLNPQPNFNPRVEFLFRGIGAPHWEKRIRSELKPTGYWVIELGGGSIWCGLSQRRSTARRPSRHPLRLHPPHLQDAGCLLVFIYTFCVHVDVGNSTNLGIFKIPLTPLKRTKSPLHTHIFLSKTLLHHISLIFLIL